MDLAERNIEHDLRECERTRNFPLGEGKTGQPERVATPSLLVFRVGQRDISSSSDADFESKGHSGSKEEEHDQEVKWQQKEEFCPNLDRCGEAAAAPDQQPSRQRSAMASEGPVRFRQGARRA